MTRMKVPVCEDDQTIRVLWLLRSQSASGKLCVLFYSNDVYEIAFLLVRFALDSHWFLNN